MSKAEDRANEKYPLMQEGDKEGLEALKYMGMEFDSVYDFNSVRYSQQAYFIEGYHQAEKDLDISWVKEVSGVKEMKRAKEEALKAYPPISIAANYDTINRRNAFEFGYLKAEKDLELTWEDLAIIKQLSDDFVKHNQTPISDEEFYKEIVKRFKERKEK